MEERPGYTLVAGRRGEGAVVAIVAPQILGQQRPDVKRRDVDLLICPRVRQRGRQGKKKQQNTCKLLMLRSLNHFLLLFSSPEETWTDLTCVSDPAQVVEDVVERRVGLLTCLGNQRRGLDANHVSPAAKLNNYSKKKGVLLSSLF